MYRCFKNFAHGHYKWAFWERLRPRIGWKPSAARAVFLDEAAQISWQPVHWGFYHDSRASAIIWKYLLTTHFNP
jgi:hypothetical protein